MTDAQPRRGCEIGLVGLGVMGLALVLNMVDHGFPVAGYDQDPAKLEALRSRATAGRACGAATLLELTEMLRQPRAIMILVPAGAPVDAVIRELLPHLARGDLIPVFEAVAAKVGGDPCVAHLGPGSAGHFVKMVHNGIEYGVMQLIAETYDLMKRGLGLGDDEVHEVYL